MTRCSAIQQAIRGLRSTREERARRLAETIATKYEDVSAADILGRSRVVPIPAARHELMVALWEGGMTLQAVAKTLGMHHTSVLHGLRSTLGERKYGKCSPGQGRTR